MKKVFFPISMLLLTGVFPAQISNTENYVETRTYLEGVSTTNPTAKQIHTVQYFDGLGRQKQIVNVKASPLGRDVVIPVLYDVLGRQNRDYLPIPQNSSNNGQIYDQSSDLVSFPVQDPTGIYNGEKIFSEKILENSSLEKILQQIQVGTDWSSKPIKFDYDSNISGQVTKYSTNTIWENNATKSMASNAGTYGIAQLYKNTTTDEDGNKTIEFKNGEGQVLLLRKVLSETENADTYFIYNEYNQLAFVIPPKAVKELEDQGFANGEEIYSGVLHNLCYQYKYDGKNRLVEKKLPGRGWEYLVYDKQDRLVATQDAAQRLLNKWFFNKYDHLGRVLYTGISIDNGDRNAVQAWINNVYGNNIETSGSYSQSGLQIFYANTAYPQNIENIVSVNYYDAYLAGDPFPTMVYDQSVLPSTTQQYGVSTKGLPVANFVKNIEDNGWTKRYLYYDLKGRLIREYSLNPFGGYTNVEKKLDFSGNPSVVLTQHKRLATDTEKVITENFTYDHQNRILRHSHQVDNNPIEYLAQNEYNELSQIKTKRVGGSNLGSGLQTVDYQYNIRGWLTKINDPENLGNNDLFGFKINYTRVDGLETPNIDFLNHKVKPKFNGNIAEISWKTSTQENEPLKRYGYVYDSLNRLLAGFYQRQFYENAKEYFEVNEYDLNGNITRLKRSEGILQNGIALQIDNLKYNYFGNRLTSISDDQENPSGYPYFQNSNPIEYDNNTLNGNGNMTKHLDKGISLIQYNYLNLPKQIVQNNKAINYAYKADGTKIKKLFGDIETHYLDKFQYKSTRPSDVGAGNGPIVIDPNEVAEIKLRMISTSEGYFDTLSNEYVYNYTDHLGNVRLSYSDTSKDGIVQPRQYRVKECSPFDPNDPWSFPMCIDYFKPGEIVEVNNYYPFGLLHNYVATTQNAYQYKYNGKELQETGMYDYGARMYMPDIGRWGVVDNKSELYFNTSPYAYALNQPTNAIDPDGNLVIFINGLGGGGASYWKEYKRVLRVNSNFWNGSSISYRKELINEFDESVMDQLNDHRPMYIDGSPNTLDYSLSSENRYQHGKKLGLEQAETIIASLAKDKGNITESIKIITHSMGGVYGKGFVAGLKEYIKNSKDPQVKRVLISLVADFDPFQAGSNRGKADPNIYTQQFIHAGFSDLKGWGNLANQKEEGADKIINNKAKASHFIETFMDNINNLEEGTYQWDEKQQAWTCTSCN